MKDINVTKEEVVDYYIEYLKEKAKKVNWKKVIKITAGIVVIAGVAYLSYRIGKGKGFKIGWIKGEVTGYISGWNECKTSEFISNKLTTEYRKGFSAGALDMKKALIDQLSNLSEDSKFVQYLYERYGITHVGKTIFRRVI